MLPVLEDRVPAQRAIERRFGVEDTFDNPFLTDFVVMPLRK
jgi:hypothetical protein